jgi:thiol:disulfide interchange protein DsbA
MKILSILLVALFALSACGEPEQSQEPAAAEAPAEAQETVADDVTDAVEETVEETLEVVEESAAVEEESDDEAIVLALADTVDAAPREWKFKEGQDYFRLVPTQPTVGSADKIEVAELFMYSCPHCFTLDPILDEWVGQLEPGVRFVRLPTVFNRIAQMHAQIYYTAEILAGNGTLQDLNQLHVTVFNEFHRRGNRLTSVDSIERLFARYGVPADEFEKAWNSFAVNQKMRVSADLTRRYNVNSVPAIVVNGKYRVPNSAQLLDIVDELLAREGLR